jgi:cytochrome c-type biogenesis protein CcmE
VIGAIVVILVLGGFLGVGFSSSLFGESASEYLTIAEVKALGPEQTRNTRVVGEIVSDSVEWSTRDLHLTFTIEDETGTLPISYHGPQPDMLVDAVEAVAIGKFDTDAQTFEAEELLMKCPSKYEEKE